MSDEDAENAVPAVEDDFVLVKCNTVLCPEKALEVKDTELIISHRAQSGMFASRWPEEPDILTHDETYIVQVLNKLFIGDHTWYLR